MNDKCYSMLGSINGIALGILESKAVDSISMMYVENFEALSF